MHLKSYLRGIGIGILVTATVFIISGSASKKTSMTDEQVIARAKELGMVSASTTLVDPTHVVAEGNNAADTDKSGEDDKKAEATKPTEVVKTEEEATEEAKVTEEAKATEEAKVVEDVKPTEDTKPTEKAEPTEEAKSTEKAEPTEEAKPTKETKPTEEVKPTKDVKPTEKVEQAKDNKEDDIKPVNSGDYIVIVVNPGEGSGTVSRKLFEAGIVKDANEYDRYLMTNGYDKSISIGNHKINVGASNEEIAKNLTSKAN